jgi:hypothetical protein
MPPELPLSTLNLPPQQFIQLDQTSGLEVGAEVLPKATNRPNFIVTDL